MPDQTITWDYDGLPGPNTSQFQDFKSPQWSDVYDAIRFVAININITDNSITDTYYLPMFDVEKMWARAHIDTGTLSVVRAYTLELAQTQTELKDLAAARWYPDNTAITWTNASAYNSGFTHRNDQDDPITGMRLKVSTSSASCTGRLFLKVWRTKARVL